VPQLVEPDRTQVTAQLAGTGKPSSASEILPGTAEIAASIEAARPGEQPLLRRLLHRSQELERERLASLYTCAGYGEMPWRRASRTISTRPLAPSLARIREM
jgi:hypothetical protein